MGSTKVNMPPAPSYSGSMEEIIRAQLKYAPEVFAAEEKYQPLYARLQQKMMDEEAAAQLKMYQGLQPDYSKLEESYQKAQQQQQLRALQERAPGYVQQFQRAQGTEGILSGLQKYAEQQQAIAPQYGLSPEEQRAIEQSTRAAYAARGTAMGDQAALGEVLNRYQLQRQRKLEEDQLQAQRQQMASGIAGVLQQQAAPALQSFYQQPMYAGNFAGNAVQSALLGQQQAGPQYFNPESQTGMGLIGGVYNTRAQGAIGQAQANAAKFGAVAQTVSQLGAAALPMMKCWVAREVYGAHNPRWIMFRNWLETKAPQWLHDAYVRFGERVAAFISDKPAIKSIIRAWMDSRIEAL